MTRVRRVLNPNRRPFALASFGKLGLDLCFLPLALSFTSQGNGKYKCGHPHFLGLGANAGRFDDKHTLFVHYHIYHADDEEWFVRSHFTVVCYMLTCPFL